MKPFEKELKTCLRNLNIPNLVIDMIVQYTQISKPLIEELKLSDNIKNFLEKNKSKKYPYTQILLNHVGGWLSSSDDEDYLRPKIIDKFKWDVFIEQVYFVDLDFKVCVFN